MSFRKNGATAAVIVATLAGSVSVAVAPTHAQAVPVVRKESLPDVSWSNTARPYSFSFNAVGAPSGSVMDVVFLSDGKLQSIHVNATKFGSGIQVNWSSARAVVRNGSNVVIADSGWLNPPTKNTDVVWEVEPSSDGFSFTAGNAPAGSKMSVVWMHDGQVQEGSVSGDSFTSPAVSGWSQAQAVLRDATGRPISTSKVIEPVRDVVLIWEQMDGRDGGVFGSPRVLTACDVGILHQHITMAWLRSAATT